MKFILNTIALTLLLTSFSNAAEPKELPNAPSASMEAAPVTFAPVTAVTVAITKPAVAETKIWDKKFVALAIVSGGSTFADSYTTLFARQNWLAGKKGVCNAEVQSAYLYGTHPTVGRAYAVASAKTAGTLLAAYYLRKKHSKLWSLPLIANSAMSLQGVTQNMMACN